MNVVLVGGSGFIGTYLCEELLDRGHDVTVLSRSPGGDVPAGAETAMGDVTAYDSIESAFEGQDVVYNLVALSPLFEPKGGNEMHDRLHRRGTENCLRAAEEHGVERFVQLSALGADPEGPTHYIRAKGRAEGHVRDSDLDWTIFRPSVVFGDGGEFLSFTRKLTPPGVAPLPGGGKTRFQPIYVEDLVDMLADSIESETHVGETYEIGGPEQLELATVARLVRAARGQSVKIVSVPMSLAEVGLRVAGAIPGFPMGPDQYRSLQFDNTTSENDISAFGLETDDLTTLSSYLGVE
ncbi:NAD(P)H-binding protein [Halovenus sp. WSH3]|uniref:NAD(P)H-binding protein n=1 Tax=Halovenus carboxidivorans TaxID=2692199 RepID=A0A6B0T4A4_9EURY|nr:complex I NDUFA9 subunit family protein [Halovenus carboxidivorans]MXR51847.1 NAD(P)H-binding protein [Halovenus carboxidivorans]